MKIFTVFMLTVFSTMVSAKDIDYKVAGKTYQGFLLDKGKNAPLVIIVHDWDGLGDYEKKRGQMLADLGYSVFALDMFGKGVKADTLAKRKQLTGALYKNRKKMRSLMDGALKAAKDQRLNVGNASVVGYCFGGTSVLEWAKSGAPLKGFASFHGDLAVKPGDSYRKMKSKIIAFHGSADQAVGMQSFADMAMLLEKEHIPHEMITYSGAPHAFTVFGSERYRKDADEKSWRRYVEFLKEQQR